MYVPTMYTINLFLLRGKETSLTFKLGAVVVQRKICGSLDTIFKLVSSPSLSTRAVKPRFVGFKYWKIGFKYWKPLNLLKCILLLLYSVKQNKGLIICAAWLELKSVNTTLCRCRFTTYNNVLWLVLSGRTPSQGICSNSAKHHFISMISSPYLWA